MNAASNSPEVVTITDPPIITHWDLLLVKCTCRDSNVNVFAVELSLNIWVTAVRIKLVFVSCIISVLDQF